MPEEKMATSEIALSIPMDAEFARKKRKKRGSEEYEDTDEYIVSFMDGSIQAQGMFNERVQLALGGGDVERVASGRIPLLFGHNRSDVVGRVVSARRESGRWDATVRFRQNDERAQAIAADIDNGSYPLGISAGIRAEEYAERKDAEGVYYFISKWRLNELSLASTPVYDVGFNQDSAPAKLADAFTQEEVAEMPEPQDTVEQTETVTDAPSVSVTQPVEVQMADTNEIIELAQKYDQPMMGLEAVKNGESKGAFLERLLSVTVADRPHSRKVEAQDREMRFSLDRAVMAIANPDSPVFKERALYEFGKMAERGNPEPFAGGTFIPLDLIFSAQPAAVLDTSGNNATPAVVTDKLPAWVTPLIERTPILGKVTMMTGLVDNEEIVIMARATESDRTQYSDDTNDSNYPNVRNPTLTTIAMKPKQNATAISYTMIANHQTRGAIERYFRAQAMDEIAANLENSLLNGAGGSAPYGIFNGTGYANTLAVSLGDKDARLSVQQMSNVVKALDDKNIPDDMSWAMVSGSTLFHDAMSRELTANSGRFLLENIRGASPSGQREGTIQPFGYQMILSNQVDTVDSAAARLRGRALFGRWSDAIVGVWANMEVVVDRISVVGQVKVSFVLWHDVQVRRQDSFVRLTATN